MRILAFSLALAAALSAAGCGSDPVQRGRIHGTITVNGNPLTDTNVIFLASDNKTHIVTLDSEGKYEAAGVALGPVKVSIQSEMPRSAVKGEFDPPLPTSTQKGVSDEKEGKELPGRNKNRKSKTPQLPPMYADAEKSGLEFELMQLDQEWSVDLRVPKRTIPTRSDE